MKKTIAIVNYSAGNIRSVINALDRLDASWIYTKDPQKLKNSYKVIFPGQGEAKTAMKFLRSMGLDEVIKSLTQPVLGICLGQQLLCEQSQEKDTQCLGIIPYQVKKFTTDQPKNFKIPHMGWNSIYDLKSNIFEGVGENNYMYFVHSYYLQVCKFTIAKCRYTQEFSAAIQKDNFLATQFHPEKSGNIGNLILKNFIENI